MRFAAFIILALLVFQIAPFLHASDKHVEMLGLDPDQLSFRYQELLEPWEFVGCKHEKSDVGLFEWDVYCLMGTTVHKYAVHLVVNRYGRTVHGQSAYEILYWVTDRSVPGQRVFDSATIWVHNRRGDASATVLELRLGVENDLASLNLEIDL